MMTSSRPYIIRALYEWIVENDCTPYLLVDATREGVEVPSQYVKEGQIVLNVSPGAVVDLNIANDWISFNGRFGGTATDILVPVRAIVGIYARENGQGMVFEAEETPSPEGPDEPPTGSKGSPAGSSPAGGKPESRPALKIVR